MYWCICRCCLFAFFQWEYMYLLTGTKVFQTPVSLVTKRNALFHFWLHFYLLFDFGLNHVITSCQMRLYFYIIFITTEHLVRHWSCVLFQQRSRWHSVPCEWANCKCIKCWFFFNIYVLNAVHHGQYNNTDFWWFVSYRIFKI
jgi:hypothetical protein